MPGSRAAPVGVGLAMVGGLTLLFWISNLDLWGCSLVYSPDKPHWPLMYTWPCRGIHRLGAWPGIVLLAVSLVGWIGSRIVVKWSSWNRPCLFLLLTILLGPGLLINGILKPLGGRPRPYESAPFGGSQPYLRPFERKPGSRGASLASGHASMAFVFLAPFFILKDSRRWGVLAAGILFGLVVGSVRVARGDHYPSDVLLAGALVFTVAAVLRPLLREREPPVNAVPTPSMPPR